MKFSDKLFFTMTPLLTLIFTVFGIWMMTANFAQVMGKETEQADNASQMFRFLFEMGYQSTEEYGESYAINRTLDSITASVERDGSRLFVTDADAHFYAGEDYIQRTQLQGEVSALIEALRGEYAENGQTYGSCVRQIGDDYFLLSAACVEKNEQTLYLGLCRELTQLYRERSTLMGRYRTALLVLLAAGGGCVYLLSRYMTRPIRELDRTAKKIAGGQFTLRSANRNRDEIGELAGSFNHMADRLVEQMERKALEAKQQEDFTAAFAHELKTPLTSIIGYADMMNSMKMTEQERAEASFYIYSQGKRLESLSHKLLELVSMDRTPFTVRRIPAKRFEENIRTTMRPIWAKRGIRGKIEMDKGVITGDEELLLSLFYNLLDNAVKAMDKGEKGFILFKGTLLGNGDYEVKVIDNGRGIPREEISRITEAFYMVDKSRSRKEGGAGIGMALCHKIIRLHHAALQIDSRLGEGTVMKVIFPKNMESVSKDGQDEEQR